MFKLDPKLERYATVQQWEYLKSWNEFQSRKKAAKHHDVSESTIDTAKRRVLRKAGQKGYAPDYDITHEVSDGMSLKGTSIRYDGDGNVQQYWNKTKQEGRPPEEVVQLPDPKTISKVSTLYDQEGNVTQQWVAEKPEAIAQAQAWEEFAKILSEDLPKIDPIPIPKVNNSNLMACYPVGDHHMGMLAWHKETGDDYDLKIGEKLLAGATDYLVKSCENCQDALVIFMGDFLHYDSFEPVTPTSRNQLDADGRFPKMVRASLRVMRYLIEKAAAIHETAHVIIEIGNHDLSSSIFLMEALKNIYENEPRITIDTSPKHFHYYRFGNNLIGTHHGHGKAAKLDQLPGIMANDRRQDWGETEFHYWLTGHVHYDQVKDFPGCRVESLRVLAAQDAYLAQNGWRSRRDMKAIVFDKEFGEVARHTVTPSMLEANYRGFKNDSV